MQGLILQLTRAGFLLLLWLFVWAVIKTLRSDIYAGAGVARAPRYSRTSSVLPSLGRTKVAKNLVVTQGALAGTRITLGTQPVSDRAGRRLHAGADGRLRVDAARPAVSARHGLYVEDLGSTNGTYLDRAKVTTAVRVPLGTPVRVGKTVIELRP